MKFFAFLMAIIVLIQSEMPCKDIAVASKGGKTKMETIQKSSKDHQTNHNDACSPFCQCACCAGFSINHNIASISNIIIYSNPSYNSFLPSETIEIAYPVWQPPQL
ncbi:MAG: hypothetical protein JST09_15960 [Bacteroidetes bacterium]|nr:hypothetical protein [Bacteroidota bacterium]